MRNVFHSQRRKPADPESQINEGIENELKEIKPTTATVPVPECVEGSITRVWWNRKQTTCTSCVEHEDWLHVFTCQSEADCSSERIGVISLESAADYYYAKPNIIRLSPISSITLPKNDCYRARTPLIDGCILYIASAPNDHQEGFVPDREIEAVPGDRSLRFAQSTIFGSELHDH
ncbi:hypothetical protein BZG36_03968 [Bifiguratus adelaidae]|uniref:Uncharacterized protein n=1 Tax=Bifiguratus adelaidae TaxID=1938954 RepID=A0A261XXC4_9FUNG|nr:hypothetical protein BZG36_03968 [Bifiguratus adelaidae]